MKWVKRHYTPHPCWILFQDHNIAIPEICLRKYPQREIVIAGIPKQLTKQQFHYFYQHPDEVYMEQIL